MHLKQGNEIGKKLLNKSLNSIADKVELKKSQNIIVFNDLSWSRDGYARADISHLKGNDWVVEVSEGQKVPTQLRTQERKKDLVFSLEDMPSLGYKTFTITKGRRSFRR